MPNDLQGRRILVVEDEYLLADEWSQGLSRAGAEVVGPVMSVETALDMVKHEPLPDGAILDVNLAGTFVFPLADLLIAHRVPVVFTTGYDPESLPSRYVDVPTCGKPIAMREVFEQLSRACMH